MQESNGSAGHVTVLSLPEYDGHFYMDDLVSFHQRFEILDGPEEYFERHAELRQVAILEELHELGDAFSNGHLVNYLDALVDLDYFNLGTILLMGQADVLKSEHTSIQMIGHHYKNPNSSHLLAAPQPPMPGQYVFYLGQVYTSLGRAFQAIAQARRSKDPQPLFNRAAHALAEVHRITVEHAFFCGLDFVEAWNRVHDANMRKERAQRASDSKRGSKYDVIKPKGWTAPDLTDLVGDGYTIPPFLADKQQAA